MKAELPPPGDPGALYLVDLSSYVLRAYHAIRELTSPGGEPTNATFGTVTMLERLVRERRPAMLAIAMDSGRDTFRREIYAEYKAHRPPAPPDLKVQMNRCREIAEAFAIPIFKQEGVEADDLIASAVRRAREQNLSVVIVAADKDLMQLVGNDVVLWDTMRDRVIGPAEVEERFGVPAAQLRDLLALMGDSSDNVPGVPHVGPKTARDLLVEHGSLEGIYEHLDQIAKKKLRENLEAHEQQARLSQRLVTLKDDCPVELDRGRLAWGGRDIERLRALYAELGFARQLSELDAESAAPRPVKPPAPAAPLAETKVTLLDEAALLSWATRAREKKRLAIEPVCVSDTKATTTLLGLALAIEAGEAGYVSLGHRSLVGPQPVSRAALAQSLAPVLADPQVQKVVHGAKQAAVALGWNDLPLAAVGFDTELAHYLLDPEGRHQLTHLAETDLSLELAPRESLTHPARGKHIGFDEVDVDAAADWCGRRADAISRLSDRIGQRIRDEGLTRLLEEVELPLAGVLAEVELRGVLVDTNRLRDLGEVAERDLKALEAKAFAIAGKEFNVGSPRQLETILFDELGLKPLKRTKTARSTDAATLEALAEEHPLPAVILEIRQISKLKGTYIDALPSLVDGKTGRIHSSWEQTVAATGRLSSTEPNLQNIPIRSELGRRIRGAFVAPPGHVILSADYSQIELRVLAHLSRDAVLLDAFRTGQDIHTRTAMEVFDIPADRVDAEHRRRAKAVNFGVIYGQGDSGLAKSLGIPRADAARFIETYFERYEGVRRFMDQTLSGARASDAVSTLLGRRRIIPDIRSGNRARRLAAERIAMNAPIQGSAADILKLAMLELKEPVTPGTRMVLTVHDELVFEVPEGEVELASERVRRAMEGVVTLEVPLVVDVGYGATWNDAH